MKRRHLLLVALSLIISICMCFCLAACDSCNDEPAPEAPVALAVPVVTIDEDGVAKWDAVEHASGYAYKISDGEEQTTDKTSVTLTDGQTIAVKAVGDGKNYSDSGFSEVKTFTKPAPQPVKLGTPEVVIDGNGLASWAAIDHATKYVVKIGETETEQTELSVQLTDGQSIQVKAVGDGTNYLTGDFSTAKTYTAGTTPVVPVKLGTPEVDIDENGLASWTAVPNATKYVVKIGETETEQTELSVQLTDGQSIQVKAVGDGENYLTGDFSTAKTYTASTQPVVPVKLGTPAVMINNEGLASWRPVDHATKYIYKIGDGAEQETTETSVQLTDGQSIIVKAVGDGENYLTGDFSEEKTYNAGTVTPPPEKPEKLMAPTVEVDDNGIASWTAIPNATKYVYRINDGQDVETTETSVQLKKGQKILVKAIGDGEKFLDSNFSAARSYIDSKLAASLSFEDKANRPEYSAATKQVWTQNGITFTNLKAKSTTNIGDYYNPVRLYKGSSINIEYGNMVKIVFNCNRTEDVTNLKASFVRSSITATSDGKAVIVKFNVALDTFDIAELDNQVRLDSIDVYVEKVPVPLTVPVITVNEEGVASWTTDENAVRYEYSLDEGATYTEITETTFQFTQKGQSIIIKAVGDGEDYITVTSHKAVCDWTEVKLASPEVEINKAGVARWEAVEHAAKYVYVIGDGEEIETTGLEVTGLTDGQSIKVKAIGQLRYTDSDFCAAVTYTAPTESSPLKKELITVTIARDGTVSVTHPNASSFKYKVNDGEETALALDATFKLTSGQSVIVKAVGDGTIYTDSDYTEAVTYTAPATLGVPENVKIVIEGTTAGKVVASWNAVDNATKYAYVVNGGEAVETQDNTVTIDLAEAGTFKVMAVGDTNTATDGNFGDFFNDSEYCTEIEFVIDNEKTYTVAEIVKIAIYYGSTKPNKEFIVSGVVSKSEYVTTFSNYNVWLKDGDKEFELYGASFDESITENFTEANALVGYTVTATGKPFVFTSTSATVYEFDKNCKINTATLSGTDRVSLAKEALTLNDNYSDDFVLPLEGKHGTTISWAIANEDDVSMSIEIAEDGKSVTILQGETDVEITLTATITYCEGDNTVTDTKDITFTIPAEGNEPIISWVKVTSVADLKADDLIVFTYIKSASEGFAMSSFASGIYNKVDLTFANGTPDFTNSGIVTVTLKATGDAEYPFALLGSDGKYIASSNTKNKCAQSDTITDNCKWKFNSTTLPTKLTAKTGTYNILQYNETSPRFSCYSNSGQKDLTIYKQVTT